MDCQKKKKKRSSWLAVAHLGFQACITIECYVHLMMERLSFVYRVLYVHTYIHMYMYFLHWESVRGPDQKVKIPKKKKKISKHFNYID